MGYYTEHRISILIINDKTPDEISTILLLLDEISTILLLLKEKIQEISGYEPELIFGMQRNGKFYACLDTGSIKWYKVDEHIVQISKAFPDLLILVEGDGEEQGDAWRMYCKDGKKVTLRPDLRFPDFDISMLN